MTRGAAVEAIGAPDPLHAPWGMLAAIDLHGSAFAPLADPGTIRAFVRAVIDAIGMRAHGPLRLARFGDVEHFGGTSTLRVLWR